MFKFSISFLIFMLAVAAFANGLKINEAQISSKTLRGSVLALHSKKLLVISGVENYAIAKELGEKKKNQLYVDFVMNTSATSLKKKYSSDNRPTTAQLIDKYAKLNPTEKKLSGMSKEF